MTDRQNLIGFPSIDKPWLKYYSEEQRNISIPECSIYSCLRNHSEHYSSDIALEYFGRRISYNQLFAKIELAAKSLKAIGVEAGEVVSVCLPNIPEAVYLFYAINRIGAVAHMLDVRSSNRILEASIREADSNTIIVMDSVADQFCGFVKQKNIICVSPMESFPLLMKGIVKITHSKPKRVVPAGFISWKEFMARGKEYQSAVDEKYANGADAVIAYTGGTTGEPKGVVGTNETINAVVEMEMKVGFNAAYQERLLCIAPPWTYYGLCNSLHVPLCMGLQVILIPKMEADGLAELTLKYKPNHIVTVPSSLRPYFTDKKMQQADLSFLKSIILGADKLDESFEVEVNEFLSKHHCQAHLSKGYGMTEVMAAAAYSKEGANEIGSVGVPYPGIIISAFHDDDDYSECKQGEIGEIAINGPTVMKTYFGSASSYNSELMKVHTDGSLWIHTGDMGHIGNDGRIYIDGRKKRMFVRNGYKVFPASIESCLLKCENVSQAAVIAVPDVVLGNSIKAFVVLNYTGTAPGEVQRELEKKVAAELYDYELPDTYEFIDKLPLTGMGKIDYKALEKRLVEMR